MEGLREQDKHQKAESKARGESLGSRWLLGHFVFQNTILGIIMEIALSPHTISSNTAVLAQDQSLEIPY